MFDFGLSFGLGLKHISIRFMLGINSLALCTSSLCCHRHFQRSPFVHNLGFGLKQLALALILAYILGLGFGLDLMVLALALFLPSTAWPCLTSKRSAVIIFIIIIIIIEKA